MDFSAFRNDLNQRVRHEEMKQHPIYKILMDNKCGEDHVIEAFLSALHDTPVI
jgi:hypothetical protein